MVDLDRRRLLVLGASALLAGCTARSGVSSGASAPSTTPPSPSPSRSRRMEPLPAVPRWQPDPNDLQPAAKLAAVRRVEARNTGRDSVVQVVDAQFGGLLPDAASVLVVCRSWTRTSSGAVRPGGATYDVRLLRTAGGWRPTAVHPSHPGRPAPRLSGPARAVLASDRIELPPAGRADVLSGQVHDRVLRTLLAVSRQHRVGVSVVRSGHPLLVFGTDRPSDHPLGRAFDTWRIDDHPVVAAGTARRLVTGYMEALAAGGSYNVGGPYLLGAAPQFFSDATHHDHVHAGFGG